MTLDQALAIFDTVEQNLPREEELQRIREIADAHQTARVFFYEEAA